IAVPTLTPEQRAEALAKAQAARKKRSELLASVKSGKVSIAQVLAKTDDITKKTKVAQVIKAMPGYGPAKAAAVMEEAGIDDNRRVGRLGEQQRKKLLEAVSGLAEAGRPPAPGRCPGQLPGSGRPAQPTSPPGNVCRVGSPPG